MAVYLLVTPSGGYTDPTDKSVWPANVVYARIEWDGVALYVPPEGLSLVPDDGRPQHALPQPAPTTISAYDFINRIPPTVQAAVMAAKPMWGVQLAAAGTIDVTNPTLLADFTAAVSAGLMTQAQATQILNLAEPSP